MYPNTISSPSFAPFSSFTIDPGTLASFLFAFLCIWLFIYTLVVIYHWWRFGRSSWLAVPVIVIHLFVSGYLLIFMVGGFR